MSEEVLGELEQLDMTTIDIRILLDDDGYFDRRCPAAVCGAEFKILGADWKTKVSDDQVFCPICREEARAKEWQTLEQWRYIREVATGWARHLVGEALREEFETLNRRQPRDGFIRVSLSCEPSAPPVVLPLGAADAMRQKFTCEECGCQYAAIGAAFFCPACGHNSSITSFDQTIDTVQTVVARIPDLRAALITQFDEDTAQNSVRQMLENSLERLVGAFQRHAETLFQKSPGAAGITQPKNVFQRLAHSSQLWRTTTGKGYEDLLLPQEMADLACLFQQRHLIAHRDGIVDQEYIDKSRDTTYAVGQRLVVKEFDILHLAGLIKKLATELRKLV
jgi:hypothetical protein